MDRRMGAGIGVVAALVVGLLFFMLVRQRAMAETERRAAEQAYAQAEQAHQEVLKGRNKVILEAGQPRLEYRVLSIEGDDKAVNEALAKLTEEKWEYVDVIPPASGPNNWYSPKMIFKRPKR